MRQVKGTDEKDARGVRKEWRTGNKECGSLLDKDANRVNLNWNR